MKQPATNPLAKSVADIVTKRCRSEKDSCKYMDIEVQYVLVHQEASRKQQAISRQKEPDEQARFGKNDTGDTGNTDEIYERVEAVVIDGEIANGAETEDDKRNHKGEVFFHARVDCTTPPLIRGIL